MTSGSSKTEQKIATTLPSVSPLCPLGRRQRVASKKALTHQSTSSTTNTTIRNAAGLRSNETNREKMSRAEMGVENGVQQHVFGPRAVAVERLGMELWQRDDPPVQI
ncbi:uncharacterized protein TrAtP1_003198 [Trichoderma atroviride]|uniref:uncharacterized protein n=1 Tax=Hypocrea atroviridis TaxID=63577 RepID=UPI00331BF56D|nr:hypothetical protein TrAtP1_003198 [Trichoderma atroviride]